jgi:UDP-N-acetyl-2-amino-2-deoxyglucuronate dehydrogenase
MGWAPASTAPGAGGRPAGALESLVPFRLALVGAGNISETHARAAATLPGVEVTAVCGRSMDRASRLASLYGASAYADFPALLGHPGLDAVVLGSPSGVHAEQGIAAARRGLHVLTEKPIDVTLARADALIETARATKVALGVFFQDRAQPSLVRLREALASGRLGRPLLASARVKWHRPPEYYAGSSWRGTWALDGGGALMNQGIHTIDLLGWLLGPVTQVIARTATLVHAIEVEDTALAILEFASGARATYEATTAAFPGYARRVELTTERGTIVVEHGRVVAADLKDGGDDLVDPGGSQAGGASTPVVSDVSGHAAILADFVAAARDGRPPLCSGDEARRSMAIAEAIYASARSGALSTVDDR